MGWDYCQGRNGLSTREYCDKQLTWSDPETGTRKVLKSAMKGSTYYAAVERLAPDGTREVWAAVFLTKSNARARDGFTFGYKSMDETVGPYERDCPAGILDLLTPTQFPYAIEWRATCRANLAKAKAPKPKIGDVIELAESVRFSDGFTGKQFRVATYYRRGKNHIAYRSLENGALYRLTNIQKMAFSVVLP